MKEALKKVMWWELFTWLLAVSFLIAGILAEQNSIAELRYFFFGFTLLLMQGVRFVQDDIRKMREAQVPKTINVFLTQDEYSKMMLVHKEQSRVKEYEGD